ncbi:MAG: 4-hydroxyphenylpyruvate dioxygenase family protein [Myxococcota bacterium]
MPGLEPLGIVGIDSVHYYASDLDRMRQFLTSILDLPEVGRSSDAMNARSGQSSAAFAAGDTHWVVSTPLGPNCRAARWLKKHPEGVGTITFQVKDIARTRALLAERGGTFIQATQDVPTLDGGRMQLFSITTAFGDVTFRFVQKHNTKALFPEYQAYDTPKGGTNRFGIRRLDHVTSNFQTLRPMLLWMEHVMGFEVYWDVEFHTADISDDTTKGSGLKSVVIWDPESQVKFATNEPTAPFFRKSQINVFNEDLRGDGVQHAAFEVDDILETVRGLRTTGVQFMPTPNTYYDMLPERIKELGINRIDEDIETLRELQVLVDGEGNESYMLQIFLKEQASLFDDANAGPFFFEIIQRKGDKGFGAGNFRALFESIERQQQAEGRI